MRSERGHRFSGSTTLIAAAVLALVCGGRVGDAIAAEASAAVLTPTESLLAAPPGLPIRVHSVTSDDRLEGTVDGVVDHDFASVSALLARPETWCDILPLHLNVKACIYSAAGPTSAVSFGTPTGTEHGRDRRLTIYLGRKYYEAAESAYHIDFRFEVQRDDGGGLAIALRAADGPFGTHDYALTFSATPTDDGRTRLHLGYAYGFGMISRLAMSGYLHTAGRNKVGFSIDGRDDGGRPIYVGGLRGVIERNAVRYHLAIQAYLDTRDRLEPGSFEQLLTRWYDLTDVYPKQLYEVDETSYVHDKQRERANQERLQAELTPTLPVYGRPGCGTPGGAAVSTPLLGGAGEG